MSAPVLHRHDVLRTSDGQLHTVVETFPNGQVLVADWTGQHPHPIGGYQVVYIHHPRSA